MFEELKKLVKSETYFFLVTPAFIWQIAFLVLPIIFVIVLSLSTGDSSQLVKTFTLNNFQDILHVSQISIVMRSILLASVTAIASLIIAYPVAYFLVLHIKRFKF